LSPALVCGSNSAMGHRDWLKARIKSARKRNAKWVRALDVARLLPTMTGRAVLWSRLTRRNELHQTSTDTWLNRYPELFDLVADLAPADARILSFGCSLGDEILSLRQRLSDAEIVGAEINRRSRAIARRRIAGDPRASVVGPQDLDGTFDIIFALAVFQREPHKISEMEVQNLSRHYPFSRFDRAISDLLRHLRPGGLLCVDASHYRVEDTTDAPHLIPIQQCPAARGELFGPNGQRLHGVSAATLFRKRSSSP